MSWPTEAQFRGILLASLVLGIGGTFIDLVFPNLIPPQLVEAHEAVAESEHSMVEIAALGAAGVVLCIGGLISLVGLWFFRRWGPPWALATTVLAYLVYPFFGYSLISGLASSMTDISSLLWGVALAMAYLPPLKERFGGSLQSPPT